MNKAGLNLNKSLERLQALSEGLTELSKVPGTPVLKEKEREGSKNKVIESKHRIFKQKTTVNGDQVFKVRYYKTRMSKHWAIFKSLFDPNKKFYSITKAKEKLGQFIHRELDQISKTLSAAKDKHGSLSLSGVASILIDVAPTNEPLSSKIDNVENVTNACFLNIRSKISSLEIPQKEVIKSDIKEIRTLIEEYKNLKTPEQLLTELHGISERAKTLLTLENIATLATQNELSKLELKTFKAELKQIRSDIPVEDYNHILREISLTKNAINANYKSQKTAFKNALIQDLNKIFPDDGSRPLNATVLSKLRTHLNKLSTEDKELIEKQIKAKLVTIRTQLNNKIREATTVLHLRQLVPLVNKLIAFDEITTSNTIELIERRLNQFEVNVAEKLEEHKTEVEASTFLDPVTKKQILNIIKNKKPDSRFLVSGLERLAKERPNAKAAMQAKIDAAIDLVAKIQTAIINYHDTINDVNNVRKALTS